jgi:outer membrane protein assembly factor BamB
MVIISAGDGVRYSLTAIDIETGNPLWETDKVFGPSVVIHQESVFALRNDATLVKLDLDTGQVEEEFPFEPASTNPGKWTYLLASDGERLFIYFGDSQELLALRTP